MGEGVARGAPRSLEGGSFEVPSEMVLKALSLTNMRATGADMFEDVSSRPNPWHRLSSRCEPESTDVGQKF